MDTDCSMEISDKFPNKATKSITNLSHKWGRKKEGSTPRHLNGRILFVDPGQPTFALGIQWEWRPSGVTQWPSYKQNTGMGKHYKIFLTLMSQLNWSIASGFSPPYGTECNILLEKMVLGSMYQLMTVFAEWKQMNARIYRSKRISCCL